MSVSEVVTAAYLRVADRFDALRKDEKGVTAVEYGVIAAATIVTIIAALTLIGPRMTTIFNRIAGALVVT